MANEVTATATISFSPTPSAQILSATSTIVESPTTTRFVRMIGGAAEPGVEVPLATTVYGILGGTPGWLWVKNIDPTDFIYIRIVTASAITPDYIEVSRLYPGEATLIKIGRGTDVNGDPSGMANYLISSASEGILYDAVVMAA